jgi:hypothetical protein
LLSASSRINKTLHSQHEQPSTLKIQKYYTPAKHGWAAGAHYNKNQINEVIITDISGGLILELLVSGNKNGKSRNSQTPHKSIIEISHKELSRLSSVHNQFTIIKVKQQKFQLAHEVLTWVVI